MPAYTRITQLGPRGPVVPVQTREGHDGYKRGFLRALHVAIEVCRLSEKPDEEAIAKLTAMIPDSPP